MSYSDEDNIDLFSTPPKSYNDDDSDASTIGVRMRGFGGQPLKKIDERYALIRK